MTTPHYPSGCVAGSQAHGLASSPVAGEPEYAWNVNFNNGNSNWNHRNNEGFALACRGPVSPGEYQSVTFQDLFTAWKEARRQKQSGNQLAFDTRWLDGLLRLQEDINAGTWQPSATTCFIAPRPKARQIHAPDFADRVVHHWLVPPLERIFEPGFIHDSYANRVGKGTHKAVARLKEFVREVHSGQGGGYYLQLDIHNFFNSIHRPTLYALLKRRMLKAGTPLIARRVVHALLRHSPISHGVKYRATPAERAQVPPHKRLENADAGCGLPIGNLSSQFFANVYLNELDQFVKHILKAKRYLRYVDDFVLVHHDRAQLEAWRLQIEQFLRERLRLLLKADVKLRPLGSGIDFLGYVVWPTHTATRRRVISHAREKLHAWQQRHVRGGCIVGTPADFRALQSVWGSYRGHFIHANSVRLRQRFGRCYPWLKTALAQRRFDHRLEGRKVVIEQELT